MDSLQKSFALNKEERTNRGLKHVRGDVESTARAEEVARQMREQREAAERERDRERRERAEAEQAAARMREAREARELKEAEDQRKKREEDAKAADIARERMQRERETEERDKDEARRKRDLEGAEEPRLPGQRGTETQVTPAVTKNADAREEPPPERAGAAVDDGTPRRESSEMHMKAIDRDRLKREAEIAAARAHAQTRLSRKAAKISWKRAAIARSDDSSSVQGRTFLSYPASWVPGGTIPSSFCRMSRSSRIASQPRS